MFKMLHPTFFAVPVAWLTIGMLAILSVATPQLAGMGITPKTSWAVLGVQAVVAIIFLTPAWRLVWLICPPLNRWFFPDLNGEWDVEGQTNWPRIDATLKAANGEIANIDMRNGEESVLPLLGNTLMRARITQSWVNIKVTLWNPKGLGPIKESHTLSVQPFRGDEGRHGLVYVFEQENDTTVVSDDRKFLGAARIVLDRDDIKLLCGQMWTDRMWRRGMNTAAEIRFRRCKPAKRWWQRGKHR